MANRFGIQIQERAKRKRNRLNMMGLRQPPGTKPREYKPSGKPVWKPMPKTPTLGYGDILGRINLLLSPWWRRLRFKGVPPGERPPEAK